MLKPKIVRLCIAVLVVAGSLVAAWAGYFSLKTAQHLKTGAFTSAVTTAKYAKPALQLLSIVSLGAIPDLEIAKISTILLADSQEVLQLAQISEQLETGTIALKPFATLVDRHQTKLTHLATLLPKSMLVQKKIGEARTTTLVELLQTAPDISRVLTQLATDTHKYIIVLQNSDELRATGGFMGSYALIELSDGTMTTLVIEDIYDADGQFKGFVPAPTGVKEYLSSANGMRLPDANWNPDFPSSAQQILPFFALGSKQNVDGVIAINDQVISSVLELIGPIWLPDYQTSVTAENLTTVLRAERNTFFAGSIQKKHVLSQFKSQLLSQLAGAQFDYFETITLFKRQIQQKNILFFTNSPDLQPLLTKYHLEGKLFDSSASAKLAFVESNVGINKANKEVNRTVKLETTDRSLIATITFTNKNKPPLKTSLQEFVTPDYIKTASAAANHLGYVNYQRVIFPSSWTISNITVGKTAVQKWDQETYVYNQDSLSQIGFIVPVREESTELVQIEFALPKDEQLSEIELYKQPGIVPPEYTVVTKTKNETFLLESNRVTML